MSIQLKVLSLQSKAWKSMFECEVYGMITECEHMPSGQAGFSSHLGTT